MFRVFVVSIVFGLVAGQVPDEGETATEWCASHKRCIEDGDAGAYCDAGTMRCVCSAGFGHMDVRGDIKYWGCYSDVEVVYMTLHFAEGDGCEEDGSISAEVRSELVDTIETASGAAVASLSYACSIFSFVAKLDVPVGGLSKVTPAALEAAMTPLLQGSENLFIVLGPAVVVASRTEASYEVANPDTTTKPLRCTYAANSVAGVLVTQDTVDGEYDYCQPLLCQSGYTFTQRRGGENSTGFECVRSFIPATDCVTFGDCTVNVLATECVGGQCVEPTPTTKTTRQVRVTTTLPRDICSSDETCQRTGDTDAKCVLRTEQGNYCDCSAAYKQVSSTFPLCILQDAEVVPIAFNLLFVTAKCSDVNDEVQEQLKLVLVEIFGGEVTTLIYVCGSAMFMGSMMASVPQLTVFALQQATFEEVVQTKIKEMPTVNVAMEKLGNVSSAGVTSGDTCSVPNSLDSFEDHFGVCQAISCVEGYSRIFSDKYSCVPTSSSPETDAPITMTEVAEVVNTTRSSSDGISEGEAAGIIIGCISFMLLVLGLLVVYCLYKKDRAQTGKKNKNNPNEPYNTDEPSEPKEPNAPEETGETGETGETA